jgi:hypothetical protein
MSRADGRSGSRRGQTPGEGALGALVWLAFVIAVWPLLRGFPLGHDWLYELVRAAQYKEALAQGQLPPVWAPDLYAGFGSPIFLFYAPLFSAATALAASLLSDLARAASAVLIGAAGIAAFSMHRLVRAAVPEHASGARVAACFYVLHPYLLCDALLRNADAEYLALALAPLPLAGLLAAAGRPRAAALRIALGLALVVLAHNLTALWVLTLLLGGALLLPGRPAHGRAWTPCVAGIGLGLALSAGFWIPALSLADRVQAEALLTGKFDFHRQFPPLASAFGYARFFGVGLLTPLVWLGAAAALVSGGLERGERRLLLLVLAASAAFLGLLLPASTPLWESLPLLAYYQFPWRFLGPLALLSALAAGIAFPRLLRPLSRRARAGAELAAVALCIANALPHLLHSRPLSANVRERLPGVLAPESIRAQGLRATVGDEYLPRTARPPETGNGTLLGPVVGPAGVFEFRVLRDRGTEVELEFTRGAEGRLELRRFAFPGWQVELDDVPVAALISTRGALVVPVTRDARRLVARLQATPLVQGARAVSALAAGVWLLLLLGPRLRSRRR